MPQQEDLPRWVLGNLRGGQNSGDPPISLNDTQAQLCQNVEWHRATVARRRRGCDVLGMTGGTAFGTVQTLIRHVAAGDPTAAELWGVDGAGTPLVKRLTGGTTWADISMADNISSRPQDVVGASLNGLLNLAYDSAVDRMHAWDPVAATIRRLGISKAATPTTSEAAGAVTATRQYKVSFTTQVSSVTTRRGELSDATGTITLVAEDATINRPALPGEGETHWETWAANTSDGFFVRIATTVIGTTTAVDANTTLGAFTTFEPLIGTYTLLPSMKYLTTDGNRLIGTGAWETTQPIARVWLTPVLGDLDVSDAERYYNTIEIKGYIDLNEKDGGGTTGISPPLFGSIYVFKYSQIWKLVSTGDPVSPYIPYRITDTVGCINHKTIQLGRDENGRSCLYFQSFDGPYRISMRGLEFMGEDIQDLVDTVNLDATTVVSHGTWYAGKHQYWLWTATGSSNVPNALWVFNAKNAQTTESGVRGGWAIYTGDITAARASAQFSSTVAASMSRRLKPVLARDTANVVHRADSATLNVDGATTYRAYVKTKPYVPDGPSQRVSVHYPSATLSPSTGSNLALRVIKDYGLDSQASASMSLTASAAAETRVIPLAQEAMLAGCQTVEFEIGDSAAVDAFWVLDQVVFPYNVENQV